MYLKLSANSYDKCEDKRNESSIIYEWLNSDADKLLIKNIILWNVALSWFLTTSILDAMLFLYFIIRLSFWICVCVEF